jgi:tetratricopeptide (TPR) repeat protein
MPIDRRGPCLLLVATLLAFGCDHRTGDDQENLRQSRAIQGSAPAEDQPFTADTHFAAGQLAESQENPAAAAAQYQAALKIHRDHAPSLYRLGVVQTRLKNYPEAVEAWKSYVRVTGGSATAYSNLGFCHDLAGNFDEARRAYEKGIARDPANPTCRVNYGLMLARNGHPADARAQLRQVLTEPQVHYNLASVFEAQGKQEEARQAYARALEIDPAFTDARIRLARLKATPAAPVALDAPPAEPSTASSAEPSTASTAQPE